MLNIINEILLCERLMEPETVDEFEVARNKLHKREKRESIKSLFLEEEEDQKAVIDEKLKRGKERYDRAK